MAQKVDIFGKFFQILFADQFGHLLIDPTHKVLPKTFD
jgi:hypothetical protein